MVFIVTLQPTDNHAPAHLRLRRLLKFALRVCRLRCISIREVPAEDRK